MKTKLKICLLLLIISNSSLIAQDYNLLGEAIEDSEYLKEYIGSDDIEIFEFKIGTFEDDEWGIQYSVGRKIPYPGTNDFNTAYSRGQFRFSNVVKVKNKKKKIILSFNSNGYNGQISYMGSGWKSFRKYQLSFQIEDKEKRKETLEIFEFLIKNPIYN